MPLLKVLCFILHADLIVYCGLKGMQVVAAAAAAKEIHRLWQHLHLSYHFVPTHLSSPIRFYLLSGTSVSHFRSSCWWHYLYWALLAHPLELLLWLWPWCPSVGQLCGHANLHFKLYSFAYRFAYFEATYLLVCCCCLVTKLCLTLLWPPIL